MILHVDGEELPSLYAGWVTELLGGIIPRERRATCDACAMCAEVRAEARPEARRESASRSTFFEPSTKCCTYLPLLPNFLVGRILLDTDPAAQPGRASVAKRIEDAHGATPLGLMQSSIYSLLYRSSSDAFGRSTTFLCPHYIANGGENGGRCGVWRNRNSVCTTWFCKHIRGRVGLTFWRSLLGLLGQVEKELAQWCVLELRVDADAMRSMPEWSERADAITGAALDNKVDRKAYARMWGAWCGREQEFFRQCAERVSPLSWSDVLAICGPEVRMHAELARSAYNRLTSDDIPAALMVGEIDIAQMRGGTIRVSTYSGYDPLDIPHAVFELLQYFDGRPTEAALAAIADERGVRVEADLVRKLVDFEMLVPADAAIE